MAKAVRVAVGRVRLGLKSFARLRQLNCRAPVLTLGRSRNRHSFISVWHREEYVLVVAQIRLLLGFQHLNGREVLSTEFKLADAQELMAGKVVGNTEPLF